LLDDGRYLITGDVGWQDTSSPRYGAGVVGKHMWLETRSESTNRQSNLANVRMGYPSSLITIDRSESQAIRNLIWNGAMGDQSSRSLNINDCLPNLLAVTFLLFFLPMFLAIVDKDVSDLWGKSARLRSSAKSRHMCCTPTRQRWSRNNTCHTDLKRRSAQESDLISA
jgi:hypothetical protein